MIRSVVKGVGGYLPTKILTNAELAQKIDTSDEWITKRTGIKQRHIAADGQMTSDLALEASKQALERAGINATDLDAIIVATTTPDKIFPSTAAILQSKLDVPATSFAFDVQAVCSGFVYALSVADNFIRVGQTKNILVVGAETMSQILDWEDRGTCVLFGDGAGAVVLSAQENTEQGIISTHLHSEGQKADLLYVDGGICMPNKHGFIKMEGRDVFKNAVNRLAEVVDETLVANNLQKSDINWLVPHQANSRIIESTAQKLDLSMDNVILTVAQHANTSAASVPLALNHGVENNLFKPGELLLLEVMGAGLTWGSALIRW